MLLPASAWAQSFTPPPQVGSVTLSWQWVDNTGHILTDGTFLPGGESVTTSVLAEVDYGVTERFGATVGVPFIFAKYTGSNPPFSGLTVDTCRCWNSSFQDLSIAGRYRFGDEFWALTPSVRLDHAESRLRLPGRGGGRAELAPVTDWRHRGVAADGTAEGEH